MEDKHSLDATVFNAEEVAQYLRTDPSRVIQLLTTGRIVGFKVGREWRILGATVLDFLRKSMEHEQMEALWRVLSDPKEWARELRKDPRFCAALEEQDFAPNTMGAFLKRGIDRLRAEEKAGNVVDISGRDRE